MSSLEAAMNIGDDNNMSDHMKEMWAGQSNVLVAVRVRPILKHDVVRKSCIRVLDSKVVVILDPATQKPDVLRVNRTREKQYAFDFAFEPGSSQEATYHHTTKFLIHGVLDGFSATVFAYGQTGSGKTFTMIGTEDNPGIMVRVMSDLFKYSAAQASKAGLGVYYKVAVSLLEVYNENIRDLLSPANAPDEYLDLREDPIKGPVVAGITEVDVRTSGEIMKLLHQGNRKRTQAPTHANEVSSRSHAVLQVSVESRDRAPGVVENIKVGKLSLIDLAGSERAANTQNRGARLVEGANINRSLLALGNCINALGEKGNKGNFVPYRDSKLTRLLKDSLGGNCRTVMIANISPAESSFEETLNTLKYANRAKNIKTQVKRNVLNVNYHISEYVELIKNLRGEIQVLKGQLETSPGDAPVIAPPLATSALNNKAISGKAAGDFAKYGDDVGLNGSVLPAPVNISDAAAAAVDSNPGGPALNSIPPHGTHVRNISTPLDSIRGNLRSAGIRAGTAATGKDRELVNSMRQMIVNNFQERMQLRRSLIELEDQNVQNSIEITKREMIVVNWTDLDNSDKKEGKQNSADFGAKILAEAPQKVTNAWQECEQIRKAVVKNNGMKRSIAKRLRHNEREAERLRDELGNKITGEDRRELMELQYQVGRLELENMELEQHRIVHESILKGKDLTIQKLKLQIAVKDKLIQRQSEVLKKHGVNGEVDYKLLNVFDDSINQGEGRSADDVDRRLAKAMNAPSSPPRTMTSWGREQNASTERASSQTSLNNNHQSYLQKNIKNGNDSTVLKNDTIGDENQHANMRSVPNQYMKNAMGSSDHSESRFAEASARSNVHAAKPDLSRGNSDKTSQIENDDDSRSKHENTANSYNSFSQGDWEEVELPAEDKDQEIGANPFQAKTTKVRRTPEAPNVNSAPKVDVPVSPVSARLQNSNNSSARKSPRSTGTGSPREKESSLENDMGVDFDEFARRMELGKANPVAPEGKGALAGDMHSSPAPADPRGYEQNSKQSSPSQRSANKPAGGAFADSRDENRTVSMPNKQHALHQHSIPSPYDSPSVIGNVQFGGGANASGDRSAHNKVTAANSDNDSSDAKSRYPSAYRLSFNDQSSEPSDQNVDANRYAAKGPFRAQQLTTAPDHESPQSSPRLILGHELDEGSVETIVSEASISYIGGVGDQGDRGRSNLFQQQQHQLHQQQEQRQRPPPQQQPQRSNVDYGYQRGQGWETKSNSTQSNGAPVQAFTRPIAYRTNNYPQNRSMNGNVQNEIRGRTKHYVQHLSARESSSESGYSGVDENSASSNTNGPTGNARIATRKSALDRMNDRKITQRTMENRNRGIAPSNRQNLVKEDRQYQYSVGGVRNVPQNIPVQGKQAIGGPYNPYLAPSANIRAPGPPPKGYASGNRYNSGMSGAAPSRAQRHVKARLDTGMNGGNMYPSDSVPVNPYGQPTRPIRGNFMNRNASHQSNGPSKSGIPQTGNAAAYVAYSGRDVNHHGVPNLYGGNQHEGNSATGVDALRKQLRNMSRVPKQTLSAREGGGDQIMGHRPDPKIHSAR